MYKYINDDTFTTENIIIKPLILYYCIDVYKYSDQYINVMLI